MKKLYSFNTKSLFKNFLIFPRKENLYEIDFMVSFVCLMNFSSESM